MNANGVVNFFKNAVNFKKLRGSLGPPDNDYAR